MTHALDNIKMRFISLKKTNHVFRYRQYIYFGLERLTQKNILLSLI